MSAQPVKATEFRAQLSFSLSLSLSLTSGTESEFIFRENLIAGSSVLSLRRITVLIFPAMYNSRAQTLFLLLLLHSALLATLVSAQGSKWSTLSGESSSLFLSVSVSVSVAFLLLIF